MLNLSLLAIAFCITAFIGFVWFCLLTWLVFRVCKFYRAFNRAAVIQPEQRNYD